MKKNRAVKLNRKFKYCTTFFIIFSILALIPIIGFADADTEDAFGSHIGGLTIQQYNPTTGQWFNQYQKFHSNYGGQHYVENETVYLEPNWLIRYGVDALLNNTWADNKTQLENSVGLGLNITGDIEYLNPVLTDDYSYNLGGFWHYSFITTAPDTFDAANETAYAQFIDYYYNGSSWLIIDTWKINLSTYTLSDEEPFSLIEDFEDWNINNWDVTGNEPNSTAAKYTGDFGAIFDNTHTKIGYNFTALNETSIQFHRISFMFNFHSTQTAGVSDTPYGDITYVRWLNSTIDREHAPICVKYNPSNYTFYVQSPDYGGTNRTYSNSTFYYDTWYNVTYTFTFDEEILYVDGNTEIYIDYVNWLNINRYPYMWVDAFWFGRTTVNWAYDTPNHEGVLYFDNIYFQEYDPTTTPTTQIDYTMFIIGLTGVLIMIGSPSWFALKLREGLRSADEIVQRFIFALILFVVGYCLILVWLGDFL